MSGVTGLVRRSLSFKGRKKYEERLLEAALEGDHEKVATLIPKCDDVSKPREDGCTPLHAACNGGFTECARLLLEAGADALRVFQGWTPLHVSASVGRHQCVLLLLRNEANRAAVDLCDCEPDQRTALHLAATDGHLDVVKALLGAGSKPDKKDRAGKTPLMLAIEQGQTDVAHFLIQGKIGNINITDNRQMTALMHASVHGLADVAEALLKIQADPFKVDDKGRTALVLAQQNRRDKCVAILTEAEKAIRAAQSRRESEVADLPVAHSTPSRQPVRKSSLTVPDDNFYRPIGASRRSSGAASPSLPSASRSSSHLPPQVLEPPPLVPSTNPYSHLTHDQLVAALTELQKRYDTEKHEHADQIHQLQEMSKTTSSSRLQARSSFRSPASPSTARRSTATTPTQHHEQESVLEDTITGLKLELTTLNAKLSRESGQRQRADELETKLVDVVSRLQIVELENDQLRANSTLGTQGSATTCAACAQNSARVHALEDELQRIKTDLINATAPTTTCNTHAQEIFELQQQLLDAESKLSKANRQIPELKHKLEQEVTIHQETQSQLATARDKHEAVVEEYTTFKMQLQAERSLRIVAENVLREEQERSASMERRLSNASSYQSHHSVRHQHQIQQQQHHSHSPSHQHLLQPSSLSHSHSLQQLYQQQQSPRVPSPSSVSRASPVTVLKSPTFTTANYDHDNEQASTTAPTTAITISCPPTTNVTNEAKPNISLTSETGSAFAFDQPQHQEQQQQQQQPPREPQPKGEEEGGVVMRRNRLLTTEASDRPSLQRVRSMTDRRRSIRIPNSGNQTNI